MNCLKSLHPHVFLESHALFTQFFFFFIQFFFFPSVLSTVITLFYIRSLDFIHHITGSLQSFTILSLFPTLTPEYHHSILFLWI